MERVRFAGVCVLLLCLSLASAALAQTTTDSGECAVSPLPGTSALLTGLAQPTPEATPCLDPSGALDVAAYKGRIEAALMAGRYASAVEEYTQMQRVVLPTIPDAFDQILAAYQNQLATNPNDLIAQIGYAFAQWWVYDFEGATTTFDSLLVQMPENVYATLFRGSSRLFAGDEGGDTDIVRALELAPDNPDVHFIAADAYLYGLRDLPRAEVEALRAQEMGLVTPRVNAILAAIALDRGDVAAGTQYFADHIAGVTTEYVDTEPLAAGASLTVQFAPGQAYRIPLPAAAGDTLTITTSSPAEADTIAVLLGPDDALITSNDDSVELNAGLSYQAEVAGTYTLVLGTFVGAETGEVVITRAN